MVSDPLVSPDPADDVADRVDLPEERKAVRAALDGLPAEQREVIELMYFGGLSQSTISERLGLPLGTVKSRTLLGMRRLRGAIGERFPAIDRVDRTPIHEPAAHEPEGVRRPATRMRRDHQPRPRVDRLQAGEVGRQLA